MPHSEARGAQIRKAGIADAARLVELFQRLDEETDFMLLEPRERVITVEQQADRLKMFDNSPADVMFVAEADGIIAGFVVGTGGTVNRNRHSLHLVVGVRRTYWGRGIAKGLMHTLESWAKDQNFRRLELTVMAHNARAIALYEKCGFEREGLRRDALRVDGRYVNEIYMSKLI